ncbi:universal stress protein [Streptomyces sp. NPDC017202]|uniref:universal stress protein n=1 Tax=Streptomyces sp. NPDC017202 TaxID=3364981 RepID=UPI0037B19314
MILLGPKDLTDVGTPGRPYAAVRRGTDGGPGGPRSLHRPRSRRHPGARTPVPARQVLLDASREAGLLVVGATRREGRLGLRLGRVAHEALRRSACPVGVVPHR